MTYPTARAQKNVVLLPGVKTPEKFRVMCPRISKVFTLSTIHSPQQGFLSSNGNHTTVCSDESLDATGSFTLTPLRGRQRGQQHHRGAAAPSCAGAREAAEETPDGEGAARHRQGQQTPVSYSTCCFAGSASDWVRTGAWIFDNQYGCENFEQFQQP